MIRFRDARLNCDSRMPAQPRQRPLNRYKLPTAQTKCQRRGCYNEKAVAYSPYCIKHVCIGESTTAACPNLADYDARRKKWRQRCWDCRGRRRCQMVSCSKNHMSGSAYCYIHERRCTFEVYYDGRWRLCTLDRVAKGDGTMCATHYAHEKERLALCAALGAPFHPVFDPDAAICAAPDCEAPLAANAFVCAAHLPKDDDE
jgi:hypothetical protein